MRTTIKTTTGEFVMLGNLITPTPAEFADDLSAERAIQMLASDAELETRITESREFLLPNVGKVIVDLVNDTEAFVWRLRTDEYCWPFAGSYSSVYIAPHPKGLLGYAAEYWAGYLPTTQPFEIVTGQAGVISTADATAN